MAPLTSTMRYLVLKPQEPPSIDDRALELDEVDVVWSPPSDRSESNSIVDWRGAIRSSERSDSNLSLSISSSCRSSRNGRAISPENVGLSAALIDDPASRIRPLASASSAVPLRQTRDSDGCSKLLGKSVPVNVPTWPKNSRRWSDLTADEEDWKNDTGEMVPPHMIVARSQATSTFSVFEGIGRTLKGRDLRRVRNAVFQKTGFLE